MNSLNFPEANLKGQDLSGAVDALCGLNRAAASMLHVILKPFIGPETNWEVQASRFSRLGLSLNYMKGPLRDVLNIPGDLVLVRKTGNSYALLHFSEQRWFLIGKDGIALPEPVDADDAFPLEAVMLRIPFSQFKLDGLDSLVALWPELRAAWAEVGISSFYISAGQLLLPIFAMVVYDKIANNGLYETLWSLTIGMIIYLATDAAMRYVRSWSTERMGVNLTLRSDETLWRKLVSQVDLRPGGFARFLSNYRDLTLSRDFVSSSYLMSLADLPFMLLYLAVIAVLSWPLMVVVLVLVFLYSVAGLALHNRVKNYSKEAERNNTRKLSFMGEVLTCLDVTRTVPGADTFLRRWRDLADKSSRADANRRLATANLGMLSTFMVTFSSVTVLCAGVYLIQAQALSIGKLIACNLLANRAMALVASLFAVLGKWQDFQRSASHMEKSLEPVKEKEYVPRPAITGNLSIIDIGKQYEGRPAALEKICFSVVPGERIALLGRPGAGKTTLLRCLAGLCRPDSGQILIDGLDLDDISRFDRMKWMTYKSQDPAVFAGTLEDNLRVSGCKDNARLSEAIWASGLDLEFKSGRMSLGMQLDERGSNLSGGQRQKIALVRAFAQPSRIVLLDEPTLGLDPESERMLAARLPKLLDSSSILIMTTHSSIMLNTVDRIIALDGGCIVADGPREKLIKIA